MRKFPVLLIAALILAVMFLAVFQPDLLKPHNPYLTASATSNEIDVTQTAPPVTDVTNLPTLTTMPAQASPTNTTSPTALPTKPSPTLVFANPTVSILEVTEKDYAILGRLCVIEARGFSTEALRRDACLSVISTVVTRALNRVISDGTIQGTIGWGCSKESQTCQFPAHVLFDGCAGILPIACAASYPNDVAIFTDIAASYFKLGWRGSCDGYIYYGITPLDPPECKIVDDKGVFTNWHGKLK